MPFNDILIDSNRGNSRQEIFQPAAGRTIEASIPAHWPINGEEMSTDSGSKDDKLLNQLWLHDSKNILKLFMGYFYNAPFRF